MKHKEQFRIAHPETVGETDSHFDLSNYADWLDNEYDEAVRQRDELKEALINVMVVVRDCYSLLFDHEKPAVKQAEAAIKNTETK